MVTSLTHVSGAIASAQTFTFTFPVAVGRNLGPGVVVLGGTLQGRAFPRRKVKVKVHGFM